MGLSLRLQTIACGVPRQRSGTSLTSAMSRSHRHVRAQLHHRRVRLRQLVLRRTANRCARQRFKMQETISYGVRYLT